jgi:hypothetical protein
MVDNVPMGIPTDVILYSDFSIKLTLIPGSDEYNLDVSVSPYQGLCSGPSCTSYTPYLSNVKLGGENSTMFSSRNGVDMFSSCQSEYSLAGAESFSGKLEYHMPNNVIKASEAFVYFTVVSTPRSHFATINNECLPLVQNYGNIPFGAILNFVGNEYEYIYVADFRITFRQIRNYNRDDDPNSGCLYWGAVGTNSSIDVRLGFSYKRCYNNAEEALAAFTKQSEECSAKGNRSNFALSDNCVVGECVKRYLDDNEDGEADPDDGNEDDGSGSGGGDGSGSGNGDSGQCVASGSLLSKLVNYYDDWVYIGKEVYGSQKARRPAPKFTGKFFDVLGRVYDRITVRKAYYTREPLPVGQEYEFAKEFEVWARIIKDREGRDIHVFRKEDELRKFRRDSSFYWDGSWEVMEIDSLARSVRSRTSLGMKIERLHDQQWRLTNKTMVGKDNDTLVSEQYVWENGRLVKMIENGLERVYIYGKTLQDPVRVVPSDDGFYFHPGYDNSVGMVPDESDPMYRFFALDPYGRVYGGYKKEKQKSYSNFVLSESLQRRFPNVVSECGIKENEDLYFPGAICIREERRDIPAGHEKHAYYPGSNKNAIYGISTFDLNIAFECKCNSNDGLFYVSYNDNLIVNKSIGVYFSVWKYDLIRKKDWKENCWSKSDMQRTYEHEAQHVHNARITARNRFNIHVWDKYKTETECIERSQAKMFVAYIHWLDWAEKEKKHENLHPKSPERSWGRSEVPCPN